MSAKLCCHDITPNNRTHTLTTAQYPRALTLNDIDGKGLGALLHPVDLGCADIVSVETGVEAVDEDTLVWISCEVHSRGQGGAVVHAQPQICGCWVSQQARQQVVLTLLPYHPQGRTAGPEQTVWIW